MNYNNYGKLNTDDVEDDVIISVDDSANAVDQLQFQGVFLYVMVCLLFTCMNTPETLINTSETLHACDKI